MKQEQLQQAQHLYFQTDLSKSEIASMLGISRRTIHYWAQYNQWERIKKSAAHMPAALAENCYFIMAKIQEDILSEAHATKPVTFQEVSSLYKLTLTINKLQKRSPLNETLEMGTHFMEFVNQQNPEAADFIKPYIDGYITSRAKDQSKRITPAKTKEQATVKTKDEDDKEAQLDLEDLRYWAENPAPVGKNFEDENMNPPVSRQSETSARASANEAAPLATQKQSITLPKNEKLLNRAQRRQLARTKIAA